MSSWKDRENAKSCVQGTSSEKLKAPRSLALTGRDRPPSSHHDTKTPSRRQRSAIDNLETHNTEAQDGTAEQRRELGMLRSQNMRAEQKDTRVAAHLDGCYWQLAQFYCVSFMPSFSLHFASSMRTNSQPVASDTRLTVLR